MKNRLLGAFALCAAVFVANEAEAASANQVFEVHNVTELTNACIAANSNGNKILMHPGVYDLTGIKMGSNTHLTMKGLNSGLWAGLGKGPEDTIVKGSGPIDVCRIVSFDKTCTVSNLTFTGAYYDYYNCSGGVTGSGNTFFTDCVFSNNYAQNFGGALDGAKNLLRCKFIGNWSGSAGGVMRPWTSGRAVYRDCYFEGNTTTGKDGGGVAYYGATWSNCVFVGNYAKSQGCFRPQGSYGNILIDCYFTNNLATGGSYSVGNATAATNCVFYGNAANTSSDKLFGIGSVYGCEITCNTGMPLIADCTLRNCRIVGNIGNRQNTNPLLWGCKMINCLVAYNVSGVHNMTTIAGNHADSQTKITTTNMMYNCTVVSNRIYCADYYSPVVNGVLVNTILADNIADSTTAKLNRRQDIHANGYPLMTNCLWTAQVGKNFDFEKRIIGGGLVATAKIGFSDAANDDYTIGRKSAARNEGYQDDAYLAAVGSVDLNGDPRVYEGDGPAKAIIDIGCYECQIPAPGLLMLVK